MKATSADDILDLILQLVGLPKTDCVENTVWNLQLKCKNGKMTLQASVDPNNANLKKCIPCGKTKPKKK